jgi:hypothetical protein
MESMDYENRTILKYRSKEKVVITSLVSLQKTYK